MNFAELKVQIEAGRRFEVEADGAKFTLRLPSDHAWRIAFESNRDAGGRVMESKAMRALLDSSVAGWTGVNAGHFVLDAGAEPIEFSPQARAELLDARQDIADTLGAAIAVRRRERADRLEEARKNSGGASSTT